MKLLKKCLSVLMTAVIAAASLIVGSTASAAKLSDKEIPKICFEPVGDELVVYLDGCGSKLLNKVVTYNRGAEVANVVGLGFEWTNGEIWEGFELSFDTLLRSLTKTRTVKFRQINVFNHKARSYEDCEVKYYSLNSGMLTEGYYFKVTREDYVAELKKYMEGARRDGIRDYYVIVNSAKYYTGVSDKMVQIADGMYDALNSTKISDLSISSISNKAYTGKAIKPDVTIKSSAGTLVKGTDYTLSYKNNTKVGTATVTVTGKGSYSGTATVKFKIVPPKTTVTAKRSGDYINLSWKAVSGVDKFQIVYSTDGGTTYKNAGKVGGSKTSCSLKLPAGTKYIIKIRSYKTVGGTKYYSAYSSSVTVK